MEEYVLVEGSENLSGLEVREVLSGQHFEESQLETVELLLAEAEEDLTADQVAELLTVEVVYLLGSTLVDQLQPFLLARSCCRLEFVRECQIEGFTLNY